MGQARALAQNSKADVQETCPVSTLFTVVQDSCENALADSRKAPGVILKDMMALKYGLQLDEFDFVGKAKAVWAFFR